MAISELFQDTQGDGGVLEWQDRALCAQTDYEAFFPEKGGSTREAKKVCLQCEVRAECLNYALGKDERFGIWGGLSERERRRLKKQSLAGSEDQVGDQVQVAITTVLSASDFSEAHINELAEWFNANLPEWKRFAEILVDSYISTLELKRRQKTPQRLAAYLLGITMRGVSTRTVEGERSAFSAYLELNPVVFEECLTRMSETEAETASPELY